jgi:hypothetical protein
MLYEVISDELGLPLFIPRTKTEKGNDRGQKARFQHLSFPFFSEGILNNNIKL